MATTLSEHYILSYYSDVEVPGVNGYTRPIWVEFSKTPARADELQFTIEIDDMVERFFDVRCVG
jgi:hypothetical protein